MPAPSSSGSNPSSRDHSAEVRVPRLLGLEADQVLDRVEAPYRRPLEQQLAGERGPVELRDR